MPTFTEAPSIRPVQPAAAKALLDGRRAVFLDVREPDEHAAERIPGARLAPLSRFDAAAVDIPAGAPVVVHCRSGKRSREAAARLAAAGCANIHDLAGGIEAWKQAGLPVIASTKAPLSLMRQTQIAIGLILLTAAALTFFVSTLFVLLVAFVGVGLSVAGATGFCGLTALLSFAPWNRSLRAAAAGAADRA